MRNDDTGMICAVCGMHIHDGAKTIQDEISGQVAHVNCPGHMHNELVTCQECGSKFIPALNNFDDTYCISCQLLHLDW